MVKGRGKAKIQPDGRVKQKQWPTVTSDICEKCPIQCPTGIRYMEQMRSGKKPGHGVTCRKELYLKRKQAGLNPFRDIPALVHTSESEASTR
jgi:hypothetical protein